MSTKTVIKAAAQALMYGIAFLLSEYFHGGLSCSCLILMGLWTYTERVRETGCAVDLLGLFSLSWLSGQGLAVLRLSALQNGWEGKTWICFFLIYLFVHLGYNRAALRIKNAVRRAETCPIPETKRRRILWSIIIIAALSSAAFAAEAVILGFVPLFSGKGHAYLAFHVSGLHYFTVHCVMVPALTVLYFREGRGNTKEWIMLLCSNAAALAVPILCVSRFQLIFAAALAAVVYMTAFKRGSMKAIFIVVAFLVPLYIIISMFRNQDAAYLEQIFSMRSERLPVWISQPYMYIAGNYENFNCMVANMTGHAFDGGRMLYPFFALTGLKFLFPTEISRPPFLVKEELSTFTMFYDSYYDFGIIGMCIFSAAVGILAAVMIYKVRNCDNPIIHMFYGQFAIYFLLSFFTTWFSDPAVWFRLAATGLLYAAVGGGIKFRKNSIKYDN